MAHHEPETFEVTEYSPAELDTAQAYKVIRQFFSELKYDQGFGAGRDAVWADMSGDQLKVHYHAYEMYLPQRLEQVQDEARQYVSKALSALKSEFKKRTGRTLKLKEVPALGDYAIEKVSLNERYYFRCWRFYDVTF
jgi:hypothetical protein